jgi:hypothetical protein
VQSLEYSVGIRNATLLVGKWLTKRLSLNLQHLKRQQEGLAHLVSIIKGDLEELRVIEHGLADSSKQKR